LAKKCIFNDKRKNWKFHYVVVLELSVEMPMWQHLKFEMRPSFAAVW